MKADICSYYYYNVCNGVFWSFGEETKIVYFLCRTGEQCLIETREFERLLK